MKQVKMNDKEKVALYEHGIEKLLLKYNAIVKYRIAESISKCFVEKSMIEHGTGCYRECIEGLEYLIQAGKPTDDTEDKPAYPDPSCVYKRDKHGKAIVVYKMKKKGNETGKKAVKC